MGRTLIVIAVLCSLTLTTACGKRGENLSKQDARELQNDAKALIDSVDEEGNLTRDVDDIQFSSKYGAEFKQITSAIQDNELWFEAEMEKYHPEVYFQDSHLGDATKRREFRVQIAQYRKTVDQYLRSTISNNGKLRELSERIDGRKYPGMNQEVIDALTKLIESFHKTADVYVEILNHLDSARPAFDGTQLVFDEQSQIDRHTALLDKSTVQETISVELAEELQRIRLAKVQAARAMSERQGANLQKGQGR